MHLKIQKLTKREGEYKTYIRVKDFNTLFLSFNEQLNKGKHTAY